MANDNDMLNDIEDLKWDSERLWNKGRLKLAKYKELQAIELENLFSYVYRLGDSIFKTKKQFEKAKENYKKRYGFLDNYV